MHKLTKLLNSLSYVKMLRVALFFILSATAMTVYAFIANENAIGVGLPILCIVSSFLALYINIFNWRMESLGEKHKVNAYVPPVNAEYILYLLLPREAQDEVIGDLNERYVKVLAKFGPRKARNWYWFEVIKSVGPLIVRAIKCLIGWDVLERIFSLFRR